MIFLQRHAGRNPRPDKPKLVAALQNSEIALEAVCAVLGVIIVPNFALGDPACDHGDVRKALFDVTHPELCSLEIAAHVARYGVG